MPEDIRLGFLFGAGISLCCGAPTTAELTTAIFETNKWRRHTDGYYCSAVKNPKVDTRVDPRIDLILRHLEYIAGRHLKKKPNYEDLFSMLSQFADSEVEYENPIAAEHLRIFWPTLFPSMTKTPVSREQGLALLGECRCYMRCVVAESLRSLVPVDGHLRVIAEALHRGRSKRVEIFSLNHDCLIEDALEALSVPVLTGFSEISNRLLGWDRQAFLRGNMPVRLNKLHGSVNWNAARVSGEVRTCIALDGDIDHALDRDGKRIEPLLDNPEILMGTFNKILDYSMGIHADLFSAFRGTLLELDRIVVSGYSFSDKAINAAVSEWLRGGSHRRMVVVSPDACKYKSSARGAIQRLMKDCRNKINLIDKGFEFITLSELATAVA